MSLFKIWTLFWFCAVEHWSTGNLGLYNQWVKSQMLLLRSILWGGILWDRSRKRDYLGNFFLKTGKPPRKPKKLDFIKKTPLGFFRPQIFFFRGGMLYCRITLNKYVKFKHWPTKKMDFTQIFRLDVRRSVKNRQNIQHLCWLQDNIFHWTWI